jgi:hypothetical protein
MVREPARRGPYEQVLEMDAGLAEDGREVVEEQRKAQRRLIW